MSRRLRRLSAVSRDLYRRARGHAEVREEDRFQPRLRLDAEAPELMLSPHWDDSVLDCWSLLVSERELNVVNVFGGIPQRTDAGPWEAVLGASDPAERARGRMAEDTAALARTGRTPLNLPLLGSGYRHQAPHHVSLDELDRALATEVPSASRVYVPAGIGAHRDHRLTRRYGRMLLRYGMPVTLYADLPYCVLHGWPSWVDGREPAPNRDVDAYWQPFLAGVPELVSLRSAEVERLDERMAKAKCEAIESYENSLSYGFRRMLADPTLHSFEVRWQLDSPAVHVAQETARSAVGGRLSEPSGRPAA